MSSFSITPEQVHMLLQIAGKRLGTTPEALAKAIQSGGLDGLQQTLSPQNRQKLASLLGDRAQAEQLLRSPDIQAILRQVAGG